jgi:hypothetical protein
VTPILGAGTVANQVCFNIFTQGCTANSNTTVDCCGLLSQVRQNSCF